MPSQDLRHLDNAAPRVMVVDGSKLVRKMIGDVLVREVADAELVACSSIGEARDALARGTVNRRWCCPMAMASHSRVP